MPEFTTNDISQIKKYGLDTDIVKSQMDNFRRGFDFINLDAAASVDNGIIQTNTDDRKHFIKIYENYLKSHIVFKFVPASGAATRMFKTFFEFVKTGNFNETITEAIKNIDKFAFYDELKKYLPKPPSDIDTISAIISKPGLNYGYCPKAVISFHKYSDETRTAIEEHLVEGAKYANNNGFVRIHFTVSPEHKDLINTLLDRVIPKYESRFGIKYEISMSEQKKSTDTIAVNLDNSLFREKDGSLLFRPAGHGTLIENLNKLNADLIFIKNVDNITTDSKRIDTIEYKKTLAGMLISLQKKIFKYLRDIDNNCLNHDEVAKFIEKELMVKISKNITETDKSQTDIYRTILNRPIRVCGMVLNQGEPGGGPFWVSKNNGISSLQIVESHQIAPNDMDIMKESTHFNPVDIICGIKDYNGKKFNLSEYVDNSTGAIFERSRDGLPLRAMERPGLWNGAMANWNTVFVEVPNSTFSPVKVANDLLRKQHCK